VGGGDGMRAGPAGMITTGGEEKKAKFSGHGRGTIGKAGGRMLCGGTTAVGRAYTTKRILGEGG